MEKIISVALVAPHGFNNPQIDKILTTTVQKIAASEDVPLSSIQLHLKGGDSLSSTINDMSSIKECPWKTYSNIQPRSEAFSRMSRNIEYALIFEPDNDPDLPDFVDLCKVLKIKHKIK